MSPYLIFVAGYKHCHLTICWWFCCVLQIVTPNQKQTQIITIWAGLSNLPLYCLLRWSRHPLVSLKMIVTTTSTNKVLLSIRPGYNVLVFRCSSPTTMSISRSEIVRRKKGEKLKNSWEIMRDQWEVMWGLWGSWEVSEGSWEVSGGLWEVSEWSWEVSGRLKGGHGRSPGGCWRLAN